MKKKDKNKGITIDKLAGMVKRGFDAAEKGTREFRNEVNERFKKIDEKFNETWLKLESLERKIIYLEDKITEHSKELKEIKNLIQKYQKDRESDYRKIISLERRIERLETKVFA